jgi:hypothetical protein
LVTQYLPPRVPWQVTLLSHGQALAIIFRALIVEPACTFEFINAIMLKTASDNKIFSFMRSPSGVVLTTRLFKALKMSFYTSAKF